MFLVIIALGSFLFQPGLQARKKSDDQENLLELASNKVRLESAARNGDIQYVQLLLEHASDLHPFDKDQACIIACEHGHIQIVELFIKCDDCNIHVRNGILLKIAVERGDVQMVQLLLDAVMRLGKYPFSLVYIDRLMSISQEKSRYTFLELLACQQKRRNRFKAIAAILYAYCRQMRARVSSEELNTAIEILVQHIIINGGHAQQIIAFACDYVKKSQLDSADEQYCVNRIYEGIAIALLQTNSMDSSFVEVDLETEE